MITDHEQNSSRRQRVAETREGRLEHIQLPVDRDPDRLKEPGEVGRSAGRSQHGPDRLDQVVAGGQGLAVPPADDLPAKGAGAAFIAVLAEDVPQCLRGRRGEQIGRGGEGAVGVHPHVERRAGPEREPPRVAIELPGGDAEVEQDEIGPELRHRGQGVRRGEVGLEIADPGRAQPGAGGGERLGILVDGQDLTAQCQERAAVAAEPYGRVHDTDCAAGAGDLADRPQQDGLVEQHRIHGGGSWKRNTPPTRCGRGASDGERG